MRSRAIASPTEVLRPECARPELRRERLSFGRLCWGYQVAPWVETRYVGGGLYFTVRGNVYWGTDWEVLYEGPFPWDITGKTPNTQHCPPRKAKLIPHSCWVAMSCTRSCHKTRLAGRQKILGRFKRNRKPMKNPIKYWTSVRRRLSASVCLSPIAAQGHQTRSRKSFFIASLPSSASCDNSFFFPRSNKNGEMTLSLLSVWWCRCLVWLWLFCRHFAIILFCNKFNACTDDMYAAKDAREDSGCKFHGLLHW